MNDYSKLEIVLVRYPFSDLADAKIRPVIIVSSPHRSRDVFLVPLTSRINNLLEGGFLLEDWENEGLNVPTAVKRGIYTIQQDLLLKRIGRLSDTDARRLQNSLRGWLGI
ncbi:MAG: type II toxin-antitoxin system PemK/MazF family toxin [Microcystis sp.]|jgi:mRNA interferase MazF|uniref:type II toxin-antitoxin system PemK/MazF family toxin n=1 Tax=Microcystis sp. TaxID=1127 RepID=UPI003918C133|nr:type II toxin-antitoxin system PemK/MazF family toxin [Microcystis aeruginosa BS13-02]